MHAYDAYDNRSFAANPTGRLRDSNSPPSERFRPFKSDLRRTKHRPNTRRSAVVISGIVLTAALAVVMPRVFSMTLTAPESQYVEVTVAPGETLWDIASTHKPRRSDTRSMVYNIRTANDMGDASVYPGQVLRVPVGRR